MADDGKRESMITVSILEDDARTLGYLSTLLNGSEHLSVIGAYTSGEEAENNRRTLEHQLPHRSRTHQAYPTCGSTSTWDRNTASWHSRVIHI